MVLLVATLGVAPALARADGTISGQVTNMNGAVISNVCARVIGARRSFTTITDIYGDWSQAVPSGRWRVQFDACGQNYISQWWPQRSVFGGHGRLIRVADGKSVKGIDGALAVGGQITGQLVNGFTGQPFSAASAYVEVDRPGRTDAASHLFDRGRGDEPFAPIEPPGLFLVSGLPSGTYTVAEDRPVAGTQALARTWYPSDARAPGRAQRINVTAGQTTTIGVLRTQRAGTITGTVRGPSGRPLVGVPIQATITETDRSLYTPASTHTFGARGRFVLRGLPAGRVSIRIHAHGDASVRVRRTVTAGATSKLDIRLRR